MHKTHACWVQGDGRSQHHFEDFTAWRLIARHTLTSGADAAAATLAADAALLQQFYRGWLLPYEDHLFAEGQAHAAGSPLRVEAVKLKAGLLRELAIEGTQDKLLRGAVAGWAAKLAGAASEAVQALPTGHGAVLALAACRLAMRSAAWDLYAAQACQKCCTKHCTCCLL